MNLELIAALVGFISTYLYVRQSIWSWPTGLLMVSLYFIIFYQVRLYADMSAQVIFGMIQLYGWWNWLHGGEDQGELKVSRLPVRLGLRLGFMALVGTLTVGYFLGHYTRGVLVYWDAATTVCSLIAQYMLANKILENWLIWLVIDIVYVGMYLHERLFYTTVLYLVLIGLCAWGYSSWRESSR